LKDSITWGSGYSGTRPYYPTVETIRFAGPPNIDKQLRRVIHMTFFNVGNIVNQATASNGDRVQLDCALYG
jgi:hypothetical protein